MKKWSHLLCGVLLLLVADGGGRGVLGELQQCLLSENPRQEKFILDESSWELMLEGEWMIAFCVPLIMACIKFERVWSKFALEKQQEGSELVVASMKLEYSETIIRRFSLHDLPTILHVKDGDFRKLPIPQTVAELKELAQFKWQETEPMPFWQHPNGPLVHVYIRYIRAIEAVYQNPWLETDYDHATWLVRTGLGLILAMTITAICGLSSFIRHRRAARRLARLQARTQKQKQKQKQREPHSEGERRN